MKLLLLFTILLSLPVSASTKRTYKCSNPRSLDKGLNLTVLDSGDALIEYNHEIIYLTSLSENREGISFKTERGDFLKLSFDNEGLSLQNLNEIISVNYYRANCRAL
ncbi:hypothetical protein [Halobacteriovorax sp. HLS]|uniref:hypothetical protein n=1 Tax=Halobacteriovorax sp. HLS TaxID=2234000 RepID=UPI000FD7E91B|nr:hypothetical protein [Halobacteriovorax sp. HLS]